VTLHRRVLISLLAAGSAAAVTVTPALAATATLRDARGDVWGSTDAVTATPSPTVAEGDITKATVDFAGSTVAVRIRFGQLSRQGAYAQYSVRLQGKQGGVVREVVVETAKRNRAGTHRVFNAQGREVDCDAHHAVGYGKDRVTVTLDRRCLSSPRAVRANINTAHATGQRVFYSDNVHDTAAESQAWSEWVHRG
jgi:hypothetical protein